MGQGSRAPLRLATPSPLEPDTRNNSREAARVGGLSHVSLDDGTSSWRGRLPPANFSCNLAALPPQQCEGQHGWRRRGGQPTRTSVSSGSEKPLIPDTKVTPLCEQVRRAWPMPMIYRPLAVWLCDLGGRARSQAVRQRTAVCGAGPAFLSDAPILIYRRLFERQVALLTQAENA